eukprot:12936909-Prorocentrum_lima.AAC.1
MKELALRTRRLTSRIRPLTLPRPRAIQKRVAGNAGSFATIGKPPAIVSKPRAAHRLHQRPFPRLALAPLAS